MIKKINVRRLIRIIIFPIFITTILTLCVVDIYAYYKTEISGTATMKVAKFEADISIISDVPDTELTNDEASKPKTVSIDIAFSSNSNVAVAFGVKILTTDNVSNPIPLPMGTALIAEYESNNSTVTADGKTTEYIINIATIESNIEIVNAKAKLIIDCSNSTDNFTGNILLSAFASQVN